MPKVSDKFIDWDWKDLTPEIKDRLNENKVESDDEKFTRMRKGLEDIKKQLSKDRVLDQLMDDVIKGEYDLRNNSPILDLVHSYIDADLGDFDLSKENNNELYRISRKLNKKEINKNQAIKQIGDVLDDAINYLKKTK